MNQLPSSLNITDLLSDGRHFSEKRGDRIHIIDSLTGNQIVTYAYKPAGVPTKFTASTDASGVTTWIEEGLQPAAVEYATYIAFSPAVIHLMCSEIAQGKSVTKLCGTGPYPKYNILRKWARVYPWIDDELEKARRDRAEYFRDKVIEEAEMAMSTKDPVTASQLRVETYKWAAGMDHEKFNPKTKIEATVNTPTQIIVHTGIVRDAAPNTAVRTVPEVQPERLVPVESGDAAPRSPGVDEAPGVIPEEMRKYDE